MRHPNSDTSLARFATGTSSREENRSILAHLLRGCAICAAGVRTTLRPEIPANAYDEILDRLGRVLAFKRPAAPVPVKARAAAYPVKAGRARR